MNLREAAEAALKAMSSFESGTNGLYEGEFAEEIAVLRAALAEPVQEPVAWRYVPSDVWGDPIVTQDPRTVELALQYGRPIEPLYAATPHRNPLTDEEIDELSRTMVKGDRSVNWLCRAIERAHGITP